MSTEQNGSKSGNSLPPPLGYPVGCVVKHCGWKIPRKGGWRYGLVLAHRDDVCCLQIDFGSYTAWVNPHAMMHLIRVDAAFEMEHDWNGLCPDSDTGMSSRDPDCPACKALTEVMN